MRRIGLLLTALALAACDPGGPNGKDGVLVFIKVPDSVEVGQTGTVELPHRYRSRSFWTNKGLVYHPAESYDWNFSGTTLEAELDLGATLVSVEQSDGDWLMAYRCDASGHFELRVRVMAAGRPRYADRTDVRCY